MYRQMFRPREVALAIGSTAIAVAAALALGHGQYRAATVVLFLMLLSFGNIARGRERAALGGPDPFGGFRDWMTVIGFGLVAVTLLLAPSQ